MENLNHLKLAIRNLSEADAKSPSSSEMDDYVTIRTIKRLEGV